MTKQVSIYRRKLLNAVLFFAKNTKYVNLTKLSKLLYLLDFTHCRQTGYPSLGLLYYTFEWGPVPRDFWAEIKDGNVPDDFKGKLALIQRVDEYDSTRKEVEVRAIGAPDLTVFSPREKRILEELTFVFRDARARDMTEISHLPRQPWDITVKTKGRNKPIDYLLCIDDKSEVSMDEARDSIAEYFEVAYNLGLEPSE